MTADRKPYPSDVCDEEWAFVARRRVAGYVRLFPELEHYRGRCTKNWSRYWARLTDRHVTDRKDKAFHSFRHTFTRKLRHARVAETTIKALELLPFRLGHRHRSLLRRGSFGTRRV